MTPHIEALELCLPIHVDSIELHVGDVHDRLGASHDALLVACACHKISVCDSAFQRYSCCRDSS
eukprot:4431269-Pleurochrysis_carterae.AAC.1